MSGKKGAGGKADGQRTGEDSKRETASRRAARVGTSLVAGVAALSVGGCCTLGRMMCKECRDMKRHGEVHLSADTLVVGAGSLRDSLCTIWWSPSVQAKTDTTDNRGIRVQFDRCAPPPVNPGDQPEGVKVNALCLC